MEDFEVFLSLNRMHQLAKKVLYEEYSLSKLQTRDKKTISQAKQRLKELRIEFNSATRYDQGIRAAITNHTEECARFLEKKGFQVKPDQFWAEFDARLSTVEEKLKKLHR